MGEQREKLWTKGYVMLILCNFLLFMNLQMFLPTVPAYLKGNFQASDFTVSLSTSLFALTAIISRIMAGQALQKGNLYSVLFIGLAIAGLATVGYGLGASVIWILLMRILFGVGFGMSSTVYPTMASNVVPSKRLGEGMGYFGLSSTLAMSIGPLLGLLVLGEYGFSTLVVSATMLAVVVFPATYMVRAIAARKQAPVQPSVTVDKAPVKSQTKWQIFDRKILLPCLLNMLLSITYGGLLSFLSLFGKEMHIESVGNFFLYNALAILLVRPISGKLFDRKGHRAVIIPGGVLAFIGLTLLSFTGNTTMLFVSAMFYGLGYGMIQPSVQAWMIKEVAPEQRGMANGMFLNSLDLGVAVGSMLLGVIAMNSSYTMMYRFSSLFMLVFVILYVIYLVANGRKVKGSMNRTP